MNSIINWKPKDKKAAICFTIDDIFPGKSSDLYEAGGDLEKGVFKHLLWLIERHPELKITLFTTADWRETHAFPQKKLLAKIPKLRDKFYLADVLKKGTMSLVNHPEFVAFLNNIPQFEIACHGLHHVHKGLNIAAEFQNQTQPEFEKIITQMTEIFDDSKIHYIKGICPPNWNAPNELLNVLEAKNFQFVSSSRDVFTEIKATAKSNMSGLKGTSLIYPEKVREKLIHFPVNFQPTNNIDRAIQIIENEGLVSIKAHMVKRVGNYIALDGLDVSLVNYLDVLLTNLKTTYGNAIWWTSMGEISNYINDNN